MLSSYLFAFAFGCVVGSFLNVVIYRLPRGGSLLHPGSHCPFCCEPIRWYDNIPIASYLLLAGRCRRCGVRISPRYALVEAATGALFAYALYRQTGAGGDVAYARLFASALLISALLACTVIDLQRQIIPDEITVPGIFLGPALALAWPDVFDALVLKQSLILPVVHEQLGLAYGGRVMAVLASVLGVSGGAGIVYASGVIGKALFRKEAMGQGDVKFMAMIGGFLGLESVVLAFLTACVVGALVGVVILLRWRRTRIPFGPYLSLGALAVMLHWHEVLAAMNWPAWVRQLIR